MSKKLTLVAIIVLFLSLFLTYFAVRYHRFLETPLSKTEVIHFVLKPGASMHRLVDDLQAKGYLKDPRFFYFLAYSKGATDKLKTGEYLFDPGTTPYQMMDQMLSGNVILHRFTIVEGWTFQQVLNSLYTLPYVRHTLNNQTSTAQALANMGLPPENPEGLFFPATYYFSLGAKDTDLLKWSYQLLEKKLNQEWIKRAPNLPYKTSYEALIAASLLEKETAIPKERPMIAGVIARRLQKGIPLQIDASIIYGLGAQYTGKITFDDLHKDTPYNTYVHRGLPPTPIALPSLDSIEATLHPDNSQNLYFVAKGDGSHQFSSTLADHNRAVQIYQLDMRYPVIRKKSKTCQSLWYLNKPTKALLCPIS